MDGIVFAKAHDVTLRAVLNLEIQIGHTTVERFDANRISPAGQGGDTILGAIGHFRCVFRVTIAA